jgi:hypothetical protein
MPLESAITLLAEQENQIVLEQVGRFPGLRALCWQGTKLYASRRYSLVCGELNRTQTGVARWEELGVYRPALWRRASGRSSWTARLCRDGFHALAVLSSGAVVAAVPGAIIVLPNGEKEFTLTHRITRGTRPLHIARTPGGRLFWGEYFDNSRREEVHIYRSSDEGNSWDIAYSFAPRSIRHVHNIVHDRWEDCLWILTGDYGDECRVVRASLDFKQVHTVLAGNQHVRAAAMLPAKNGLYFASDTPLQRNHIFRLDRSGALARVADLSSSSIYGCAVGDTMFFSTMVEPSAANTDDHVRIYAGGQHCRWKPMLAWKKDFLPMRYFQYGNAILPDGENASGLLAITTIAVEKDDLATTIWRVAGTKSGHL